MTISFVTELRCLPQKPSDHAGLGVDRRVAMIEVSAGGATDEVFVYHENRLGHVIALADSTGALTDKYIYTPFGVQSPLATSDNPFGGDLIHWIKS